MIRITSKKDGFRRCGIAHGKEPTEYADDRFSQEELEQLKAEPLLTVEEGEGSPAKKESAGSQRPNAKQSIALVEAAETIEKLDQLAEGEDRKSVNAAIEKRRDELTEENKDQQ